LHAFFFEKTSTKKRSNMDDTVPLHWLREEDHLGYLKFDQNGLCVSGEALSKLSAAYHRTKVHAPWLLKPKARVTKVALKTRLKWLGHILILLFAISLSDINAMASFFCIFLPHLHTNLPQLIALTYQQGKVFQFFFSLLLFLISIILFLLHIFHKLVYDFRKQTLNTLSTVLTKPHFGLLLVSFCELSWSQYKKMISFFRKSWNDENGSFSPEVLTWNDTSLSIPRLLPSAADVKDLWNYISIKDLIPYHIIPITGVFALECLIPSIIEYIYGNAVLYALLQDPLLQLEVIVTLDAFPVAAGHCFLMSITLGNFGLLSKCSYLHFIAALAACSDDDCDLIAQIVHNNFRIIDQLLEVGEIFIKAVGRTVPIIFNFGGDDKILRLITGMARSSSKWCCFYCFWSRNVPDGVTQCTIKRSVALAMEFATEKEHGHIHPPLLKNLPWKNYKMCVLHALMSMGRLLCHWIHEWCGLTENRASSCSYWTYAQAWLDELHINIQIAKPPVTGSWNCKGTHLYIIPFVNTRMSQRHFYCTHVCFIFCLDAISAHSSRSRESSSKHEKSFFCSVYV
jgi:hypothetical protein